MYWKYLEWPTNEDIKYIFSLVIMQELKPSPVSIYTCIAKLKATVGQRIAAFREETNQTWHVLTALMYNDLSSFLRERSLAQRRSEGPRARNASQSSGALVLASWSIHPLCDLEQNPFLSHKWRKLLNFYLPGAYAVTWRLKHTRAGKHLLLYWPDSLGEGSTFNKLHWSNQLSDLKLTGQILI